MDIKMKVVEVHEKERSVVVEYWTEALLSDLEPVRAARTLQLVNEGSSPEAARAQAESEYFVARSNITLYQDPLPVGQELVDFLMSQAPWNWLRVKSEQVDPDAKKNMDSMRALKGVEDSKPYDQVRPAAAAIPVSKP